MSIAHWHFNKNFAGKMTATGKESPENVFIIGCGTIGLAAISRAKQKGSIIRAFDTRPSVKEQVESLGAEFIEVEV